MPNRGLWQWTWKELYLRIRQNWHVLLIQAQIQGGCTQDHIQFSNWDNWVIVIRIRKSASRFWEEISQFVLKMSSLRYWWDIQVEIASRDPEFGVTGMWAVVEARHRDNEHKIILQVECDPGAVINCMWLVMCRHDPISRVDCSWMSHNLFFNTFAPLLVLLLWDSRQKSSFHLRQLLSS